MWALRAFLIGVAAFAVLLYAAAAALGVTADVRGWESFEIGLGSLELVRFERWDGSTSFELGFGLFLLAIAGAAANVAGAALVRRGGEVR